MAIISNNHFIRKLEKNDPNFLIQDGSYIIARAGFEVSDDCPTEYRMLLYKAFKNNWIKPVAYMHEKELMFVGLSK